MIAFLCYLLKGKLNNLFVFNYLRGGNYNNWTDSGIFTFGPSTTAIGGPHSNNSFRLVMGDYGMRSV